MNGTATTHEANLQGAIRRRTVVWLAIPSVIVVLLVSAPCAALWKFRHERAAWKTTTLERLAGLSLTNESVRHELEMLGTASGGGDSREWVGDNVLLMTNGEHLVYATRHGFNNGFLDHLFLAHGSDGRWLYSTYHFCNQMAGARFDAPPGSINEFVTNYSAREFDGKSDVCLQHTWPVKR